MSTFSVVFYRPTVPKQSTQTAISKSGWFAETVALKNQNQLCAWLNTYAHSTVWLFQCIGHVILSPGAEKEKKEKKNYPGSSISI